MRSAKLSLRQQITLIVGLLALSLVVINTIGAASIGRGQAERLIRNEMAELAATMSASLDRIMFERFREIRNLASLEALRNKWIESPDHARAILSDVQSTLPDYTWIGFADANGVVRAATRNMREGASVAARPWFRDGLKGATVGDVHEAQLLATLLGPGPNGEPFRFVDVAAPVKNAKNEVVGVLGAHLSWSWADDVRKTLLATSPEDDRAEIWILSSDGSVLLGPAVGYKPFDAAQIAAMRRDKRGSFDTTSNGDRTLIGYAITSGYREYTGLNWIVVARRPAAIAFARANEVTDGVGALGALLAIAAIIAVFYLSRRLAAPIAALTHAARQIGRNPNATMLPRVGGSTEIVDLSAALRALLRRVGSAEQEIVESSIRQAQDAERFAHEIDHLRHIADTDPLTGLLNRRAFLTAAEDAMVYYSRYRRNIGILVVDIDFFKRINDSYGHTIGDAVIKNVSEALLSCVRATDKVARFGGEEFVILLREIGDSGVRALAERMRNAVRQSILVDGDNNICVTVSIGAALVSDADQDVQDLIERADRALYGAKAAGRNRVEMEESREVLRRAA